MIFGVVGGIACNLATKLKFVIGIDDGLDIFAEHAVGGIVGNLLTGLFAAYVLQSRHSHLYQIANKIVQ